MKYLIATTLAVVLMGSATAHQLKTAVTTVLFNERTGNIEVMHRFNLHDAEHAVAMLFDSKRADIHDNAKTRAQFAGYVMERFQLATLTGERLALVPVGQQIDGANIWVYQEVAMPKSLAGLKLKHQALQDIWASQQNLVNIEGRGPLQSLTFQAEDDWLEVSF
ncbi:MAG TPA: DUF6702 family protein [Pseudidiomarina sp.]|nr:DUF6702 family protein [Pseudidiomarina sp.]